jgi:hypothetical protein
MKIAIIILFIEQAKICITNIIMAIELGKHTDKILMH